MLCGNFMRLHNMFKQVERDRRAFPMYILCIHAIYTVKRLFALFEADNLIRSIKNMLMMIKTSMCV
jgi:hypothetical protein